ncbi:unnamed protein product [Diplocarpon coronariae]
MRRIRLDTPRDAHTIKKPMGNQEKQAQLNKLEDEQISCLKTQEICTLNDDRCVNYQPGRFFGFNRMTLQPRI